MLTLLLLVSALSTPQPTGAVDSFLLELRSYSTNGGSSLPGVKEAEPPLLRVLQRDSERDVELTIDVGTAGVPRTRPEEGLHPLHAAIVDHEPHERAGHGVALRVVQPAEGV